jgi:integrase
LRREDVREIDGIPVAVIQPSEDRRLKNDSSARNIPIPAALVQEGFLEWVACQGDGLLFQEPRPPAADPRRSHYASIRLAKIIRDQAGVVDRTAVFHSTRHFVTQSLVDAGCEERVIQQIVGHASKSMTARYSRGGMPLGQLKEAMERRSWGWEEITREPE